MTVTPMAPYLAALLTSLDSLKQILPSNYTELDTFDFEKLYYVVAVAKEAGHRNLIKADGILIADTCDQANWGLYTLVDFDSTDLVFRDETAGYEIVLNPYCASSDSTNCGRFKVVQLNEDSNLLDYLPYPTYALKDDIVVGFDDFASPKDGDFDDLIVILRPQASCPEPAIRHSTAVFRR